MSPDTSLPDTILVLGDPETRISLFVKDCLDRLGVRALFANGTEEYELWREAVPFPGCLLLEPDWDLVLTIPTESFYAGGFTGSLVRESEHFPILIVQWEGANWSGPWECPVCEVSEEFSDREKFLRHFRAWVRDVMDRDLVESGE